MLVGRGGGLRGAKVVNDHFVNKLAFPLQKENEGGSSFLTVRALLLTVELPRLHSVKVLMRRNFPL